MSFIRIWQFINTLILTLICTSQFRLIFLTSFAASLLDIATKNHKLTIAKKIGLSAMITLLRSRMVNIQIQYINIILKLFMPPKSVVYS